MSQTLEELFTIKHHGAIEGVTGSCHELTLENGDGLLVDCGLFQGSEISSDKSTHEQLKIPFPIAHIQALIVTHVHIDHVGRIPYLLAAGFNGPIICSRPSALLLPIVLEDAFKMGFSRDRKLVDQYLDLLKQRIIAVPYNQWYKAINGSDRTVKVKLKPAGHIIGSAYVECLVSEKGKKTRIVFSGDIGAPYTPLLPAPKAPYRADLLVMESTYGDKTHPPRQNRQQQLKRIVEHALGNRGVLLIPAFSIGRTQEILYEIEQLIFENKKSFLAKGLKWQDLEVIVDSPLANRFTEQYRRLRYYWDKEAKRRHIHSRHPLNFEQLLTVDDHDTHIRTVQYLAKTGRPAIVISASGMCSGGRIINYLKALLGDERHDVLFIGYQAQGTPGRIIQQYGPKGGYVELDGEQFTIQAKIHTISAYSAHADQADLIRFVKRMRHKPKEIRLVHGDYDAKRELKNKLMECFKDIEVKF